MTCRHCLHSHIQCDVHVKHDATLCNTRLFLLNTQPLATYECFLWLSALARLTWAGVTPSRCVTAASSMSAVSAWPWLPLGRGAPLAGLMGARRATSAASSTTCSRRERTAARTNK
jgi:hypothetical protein